jgi:mannose-6-phosphate isomerase-like protein (cupin superfamily)
VDGTLTPVQAGDIVLIEPGEDHHLRCEGDIPLANLWLHARDGSDLANSDEATNTPGS